MDNIKDYTSTASLNEMEMMVKVCKKEIEQIKSVEVEYKETKKVGSNIDAIKKDQADIKIKFKKDKEHISQIKNVSENIKEILNYYFGEKYDLLIGTRIIPLEGDLARERLGIKPDLYKELWRYYDVQSCNWRM